MLLPVFAAENSCNLQLQTQAKTAANTGKKQLQTPAKAVANTGKNSCKHRQKQLQTQAKAGANQCFLAPSPLPNWPAETHSGGNFVHVFA
jgi:hypothetical protein